MNLTPRAARQLRALDPADVAEILDTLGDHSFPHREHASLIEVETPGGVCLCFVARHKDDSLVLLSIVHPRQETPR